MDQMEGKSEHPQLNPLLEKEYDDEEETLHTFQPQRSHLYNFRNFLLLQTFLIMIYTWAFYLINASDNKPKPLSKFGFQPVLKSLAQKPRFFAKHGNVHSPYAQPPSPETATAWATLLSGGNMYINAPDLPHNTTSVLLTSSSSQSPKYLGKMAFYHELHCLYKLKTHLYPSHYYPNATAAFMDEEKEHLEHCIEWIRTAAICRGDTTLTLFEWVGERGGERLETMYPVPHMCFDEAELLGWTEKEGRKVNIDAAGALVGPEGEGSHLTGGHGT